MLGILSCETSNAQTHTEIGFLSKAGHCFRTVVFNLLERGRELGTFILR